MTWYRPPNSHVDVFNHFEQIVERIDSEGKELYILNDLNCDVSAENKNNNTKLLMNIVNDYNLGSTNYATNSHYFLN